MRKVVKTVMQPHDVVVAAIVTCVFVVGCETQQVPVTLQYQLAANEKVDTSLVGAQIGIVPFQDSRTERFLYGKHLYLAEGQDAGVWVANALRVELEHAGAAVTALQPGASPGGGRTLTGQVAVLRATGTGWAPGGLLGAAVGTGYAPQIALSVQLLEEGVPLLSRQYDLTKNVPSNPAVVALAGRPTPASEVPPAFAVGLKELIRKQVLPDIAKAIRDDAGSPVGGDRP